MSGLLAILTNVPAYVEQPGRRVMQQKRNSLDTLDTIFVGPTSSEIENLPAWGSQHPIFKFMVCETADVTSREGGLSEIHAHYVGKIQSQTSTIITSPVITSSWHEQSLSWTTFLNTVSHIVTPGIPPPPDIAGFAQASFSVPPVTALGYLMVSYSMRYTSKSVTFRYLTNLRPDVNDLTFNGAFSTPAVAYLGFRNKTQEMTGSSVTLDKAQAITATVDSLNALTDVQINDMDNGWYEVSEIYMYRFVVNTTLQSLER